jgi:hypothetical protein
VDLELTPLQPEPVERAVGQVLAEAGGVGDPRSGAAPDPWWQAGIDEALET